MGNDQLDARIMAAYIVHDNHAPVSPMEGARRPRPEEVDLIYNEYGMLPRTWKVRRLVNLHEAYFKYRGRRLTDEEILQIKKVKEENPPEISAEWISEKTQELFPDAGWGVDLEWIRKNLGRKGRR